MVLDVCERDEVPIRLKMEINKDSVSVKCFVVIQQDGEIVGIYSTMSDLGEGLINYGITEKEYKKLGLKTVVGKLEYNDNVNGIGLKDWSINESMDRQTL